MPPALIKALLIPFRDNSGQPFGLRVFAELAARLLEVAGRSEPTLARWIDPDSDWNGARIREAR